MTKHVKMLPSRQTCSPTSSGRGFFAARLSCDPCSAVLFVGAMRESKTNLSRTTGFGVLRGMTTSVIVTVPVYQVLVAAANLLWFPCPSFLGLLCACPHTSAASARQARHQCIIGIQFDGVFYLLYYVRSQSPSLEHLGTAVARITSVSVLRKYANRRSCLPHAGALSGCDSILSYMGLLAPLRQCLMS